MNTINDLNSPGNVSYNQQSSYAIVYGSSAGNATVNTDKYYFHTVQKQVPLTSITNAVRDVLIDWSFTNTPVANVVYTGPLSNIGVQQVAPQTWRMYGVRTVSLYDEAFANTVVWDNGTANTYTYTTLVQDQLGNNRSFSTAVNVRAAPTLAVSGPVIYNEDTTANITVPSVSGNANTTAIYTLTTTIPNLYSGNVANTTTSGTQVKLVGNIVSLNAQISTGNLKFNPARDFTSNVANQFGFALSTGGTQLGTANANLQIGNTHNEYSLTTSYTYSTNGEIGMVFDILDLDPNVENFTVSFDQTVGPDGIFLLNSVSQGLGNVLTITDSKANINAANVTFVPYPSTSNSLGFTYSQSKLTTDGNVIVQANAVNVTATCPSPTTAYTLDTDYGINQNERAILDFTIPETDARANLYNITIQQVTPNVSLTPGVFQSKLYFLPAFETNIFGNVAVISATKGNINAYWGNISYNNTFGSPAQRGNSAGLSYYPPSDQTANVTLAFSMSKNNSLFGNITLANAEPITVRTVTTYGTWILPSGNTFSVNQDSAVNLPITVDNRDRRNLLSDSGASEEPWGGAYRYWLNNITPSGNNLQGRFYRATGTDVGNIGSVTPINPRDWTVGATDYTQDTDNGVQWNIPGPVPSFNLPGDSPTPGYDLLIYYPPPNYVGNVQLSVDITKSRYANGVVSNVQVGNTIELTVTSNSTSPTLYTGPGNISVASTANTRVAFTANISDPVGRNVLTTGGVPNPDWANGVFHGRYTTSLSIPNTSLGNLVVFNPGANTSVNLGNTLSLGNANSGIFNNRWFSGNASQPELYGFQTNGNAGNVVLSTTVTRIHPDSPDTVIGTSTSTITIT
jgi:hypothetical protein